MKRIALLILAAAVLMMLTATSQTACADDDGIETDAELTLKAPASCALTEEEGDDGGTDVPAPGGDCEFK
jgi:hypothetical protein